MPWEVVAENDEYCVYKLDEAGDPSGEALACHDTEEDAEAQVAALYASEEEESTKATWSTAMINDLPDSAFLYIESGGEKDDEGKTTPRSLRHFPYRDAQGNIDLPHLRNALARIPQSNLPQAVKDRIMAKAQGILEKQREKSIDLDDLHAVKALGQNRLGGYLTLWGSPEERDLTKEYFSPRTKYMTKFFDAVGKTPLMYQHGKDGSLQFDLVGHYDLMQKDEVGLWAEMQLDAASKYRDAIRKLVAERALGQSSQTLVSARKVAPDGHIDQWIIVEGSLTPTPCEPRMMDRPVSEIKAAYKALELELPELDESEAKGGEESRSEDDGLELARVRLALLDL